MRTTKKLRKKDFSLMKVLLKIILTRIHSHFKHKIQKEFRRLRKQKLLMKNFQMNMILQLKPQKHKCLLQKFKRFQKMKENQCLKQGKMFIGKL